MMFKKCKHCDLEFSKRPREGRRFDNRQFCSRHCKDLASRKDVESQVFGYLTAIEHIGTKKDRTSLWLANCKCGKQVRVSVTCLLRGDTRSCGCLHKEISAKICRTRIRTKEEIEAHRIRFTTHGMSYNRLYKIFRGIKNRCNNSKDILCYKNYGERGIKMLWSSFEEFSVDMSKGYMEHVKKHGERNTTIERINNNGPYSKENCRWATYKEQGRNTTKNVLISHNGTVQCITAWAEQLGIKSGTLWYRIRAGWEIEEAFNTPVGNQK